VRVKVRLFAALRESAGRSDVALELPEGATAEDAFRSLVSSHPALGARRAHLSAAVNRRYAAFDAPLAEGDEVVFIPPVSGG
jgi:molybdopterin converting factor subunit 1